MSDLFTPVQLGAIHAPNRILMAPLTRGRATHAHVPTPLMAQYYTQRSGAGLIISEAIGISQQGLGWPFAPGLWSAEQVAAWRPIVQAVHDAGGRIMAQLWHMGRTVHSSFLGGEPPVSASATVAPGETHTYLGKRPYDTARPLRTDEVPGAVEDYRRAARHALQAGFDGVELHAANGYLIDQFLRDGSNRREDAYGGSIENRLRLLREVTQALIDEVGADRVAVRLSPNDDIQGCSDSDPQALFVAAAQALSSLNLAFLELRVSRPESSFVPSLRQLLPAVRQAYRGTLVLNQEFGLFDANAVLQAGEADAIAFGRPFIANPDLPQRLARGVALSPTVESTLYAPGAQGYTDYPSANEQAAAAI